MNCSRTENLQLKVNAQTSIRCRQKSHLVFHGGCVGSPQPDSTGKGERPPSQAGRVPEVTFLYGVMKSCRGKGCQGDQSGGGGRGHTRFFGSCIRTPLAKPWLSTAGSALRIPGSSIGGCGCQHGPCQGGHHWVEAPSSRSA